MANDRTRDQGNADKGLDTEQGYAPPETTTMDRPPHSEGKGVVVGLAISAALAMGALLLFWR